MVEQITWSDLGYPSVDEYLSFFEQTLLPTNQTFSYFVDWDKVYSAVNEYKDEIHLLQTLTTPDSLADIESSLRRLLQKYPQVLPVIPLLLAERVRGGKLEILDEDPEVILTFSFKPRRLSQRELDLIIRFIKKTGVLNLLTHTRDIYTYLLGVEVGLDSNARKNRSGKIYETLIQKVLYELLSNEKEFQIIPQDPSLSLYDEKKKRHDFVVYRSSNPLFIIEVNFYNTPGSKPISIAESYIPLALRAKERGLIFLWVTDGRAWKKNISSLRAALDDMLILNYHLLKKHGPQIFV